METEIVKIKEDGDLVTLRATRRFLEDLVVFLKDAPAVSYEIRGCRGYYVVFKDLLEDLGYLLAEEEGDVIEFQRDETYFFYELQDVLHMDIAGVALDVFPKINALPRERVMEMDDLLWRAYRDAPQES